MISRFDRAVIRYLTALSTRPDSRNDAAVCAWLDRADRLRFTVLELLLRRPRYRRLKSRRAWKRKDNPHRPIS
ncbi:MAG: hypothetical protein KF715_08425 [Candidatus Didemnitutus sp.]|nr:hypothetical protein [Candidatus Didemnitutus sp.]